MSERLDALLAEIDEDAAETVTTRDSDAFSTASYLIPPSSVDGAPQEEAELLRREAPWLDDFALVVAWLSDVEDEAHGAGVDAERITTDLVVDAAGEWLVAAEKGHAHREEWCRRWHARLSRPRA